MQFNLWTLPIHCQIWTLTIDLLPPQIFRAYLEFTTHKSLLSAGASDLYTWHILSLHFKFLLCANLMTNLEFPNEFATIAYEFLYLNITIAMRMHLWDIQIWRRLPWMSDSIARPCKSVYNWNVCIHHVRNIRNSFSCSAVSKPHSHNVILIYVIPPF